MAHVSHVKLSRGRCNGLSNSPDGGDSLKHLDVSTVIVPRQVSIRLRRETDGGTALELNNSRTAHYLAMCIHETVIGWSIWRGLPRLAQAAIVAAAGYHLGVVMAGQFAEVPVAVVAGAVAAYAGAFALAAVLRGRDK